MLPLIIAPNKILRTPTKELALPLDAKILKLIPEMFAAIEYYKGIGLAAPQINASFRLMVMATTSGPKAFINPKVVKASRTWRRDACHYPVFLALSGGPIL